MTPVLLVGAGARGAVWASIVAGRADATLAGIVDPSTARQASLPQAPWFASVDAALAAVRPAAAIVATPPEGRTALLGTLFAAGIPVLCEKPLAASLAEAAAIVQAAEAAGVPLSVGLNFRYLPVHLRLRELLAAGEYGPPGFGQFLYHRNRDGYRPGLNRYPLQMRHPMMLEQSVHHLDLIRFCYGREITAVSCRSWNPPWSQYAHDANVSCLLSLEGGLEVDYTGSWAGGWDQMRFLWRTDCADGVLLQRALFGDLAAARRGDAEPTLIALPEATPFIDDSRALLDDFLAAIRTGAPAPCSGRDHLRTLAVCEAAIRSDAEGRRIALSEVEAGTAWMLEKGTHHLNHGGYGATPIPVLQAQQHWRERMEAQPTRFFSQELPVALREAAAVLGAFIGAEPSRLGFVENATSGVNAVLNSLQFQPGDELLTTQHCYGAVRHAMRHAAARWGAHVIEALLGLPLANPAQIVSAIEGAISPATRLVVVDHIASPSAVVFPVAEIAALCRSLGVMLLVDGAHAPGMVDLDVDAIGADWYVGNLHKWLCAPKGAGFIVHAARALPDVHPTTISHAYGQGFAAEFDKTGTRDATPWLAVPAAIGFHRQLGGAALRQRNHARAVTLGRRMAASLGSVPGAPDAMFGAMATVRLPGTEGAGWPDTKPVHDRLARHGVEVPVMALAGHLWLRVSVQDYVTAADEDALLAALAQL